MTKPLVCPRRAVESRLRVLSQTMNSEFGFNDQRLGFSGRTLRNGPTIWYLENRHKPTELPDDTVVELAMAAQDEAILAVGYNEEWQPSRGKDQIEFIASNLLFAVGGVDIPELRFRLEWAGLKTEDGSLRYPGVGAAHPHWQFDLHLGWFSPLQVGNGDSVDTVVKIDLDPVVEIVDLEGSAETVSSMAAPVLPSLPPTLASFHRMHLPARAAWHETACVMPGGPHPQQHTPNSGDEIDNWLISALRYLKSEFGGYM